MKHSLLILIVMTSMMLLLAACGGDSTAAATIATAAPEVVAESTKAPTAVAPTSVTERTSEPEPTKEPTPVVEPTPTATTALVDNGTASESVAGKTACDHPYWPMREGARWVFSDGADTTLTWEITAVTGNLENAQATMQMTIGSGEDDLAFTYTWDCSADKGLVSYDFAGQSFQQSELQMDMQVVDGSGAFLPPADLLHPGYSWDTTLDSSFTMGGGGDSDSIEINGTTSTKTTSTVTSADPVTFDGRTVDGLQIDQTNAIAMTMDMLGNSSTTDFSMTNDMVLGRGIGVIHQTSHTDLGDITMELVEVSIP